MATKKKTKSRIKAKKPAAKKTKKKVVKKKAVARKSVAGKSAPAKRPAAPRPAVPTKATTAPVALPGEERIGVVTHYYSHLSVAIIQIETGSLRTGDTVHIKGHTSDFRQTVESMELDHVHIDAASAGQAIGLRVKEHAREADVVYKVANP